MMQIGKREGGKREMRMYVCMCVRVYTRVAGSQ
jgi:hypothetical protein